MDDSQQELFERIRERCRQQSWYGPDTYKAADRRNLSLQTNFAYPPATEEQLAASEKFLGYTLPPLLRALYATIANGGFGPGYGLNGVIGGPNNWIEKKLHRDTGTIDHKNDHNEEEAATETDYLYYSPEYREIPLRKWPKGLYTLCHWGCGIHSYLDCFSGRIYRGEAFNDAHVLCCEATSLYGWLAPWTRGLDLGPRVGNYSGSPMQLDDKDEARALVNEWLALWASVDNYWLDRS